MKTRECYDGCKEEWQKNRMQCRQENKGYEEWWK